MLTVKVLGSGCANCKRLEEEARAALESASPAIDFEIIKVTDYADIMGYGVMSTPGLVMNEKVVSTGHIPKRDQILEWAAEYNTAE